MTDIAGLDPAQLARQLGHPEGDTGIAVGNFMQRSNAALIAMALLRAAPRPGERILEIGFGNGAHVAALLERSDGLSYDGVDQSATMVKEACLRNRGLAEQGRAAFHCCSSDAMPLPPDSFERAVAINVIYFWPEPARHLAEIRRVLKPGGTLALAAMDRDTAARMRFTQHGFRIYDAAELEALHRQAGFAAVEISSYRETIARLDGGKLERCFHIVLAHKN